jgi:hypothetical protein
VYIKLWYAFKIYPQRHIIQSGLSFPALIFSGALTVSPVHHEPTIETTLGSHAAPALLVLLYWFCSNGLVYWWLSTGSALLVLVRWFWSTGSDLLVLLYWCWMTRGGVLVLVYW